LRGILRAGVVSARRVLVRGSTHGRRRLSDERGQALVEFVLLLPIFLVIVFGVIEFGRGINYWIDVTHLSNEGSRYASVAHWPGCPSDPNAACPDTLPEYLEARANTGELRSIITADVCYVGTEDEGEIGSPIRVIVRADFDLPLVSGLFDAMGLGGVGTLNLRSESTLRSERVPTTRVPETTTC
jgi:hypothetical protein